MFSDFLWKVIPRMCLNLAAFFREGSISLFEPSDLTDLSISYPWVRLSLMQSSVMYDGATWTSHVHIQSILSGFSIRTSMLRTSDLQFVSFWPYTFPPALCDVMVPCLRLYKISKVFAYNFSFPHYQRDVDNMGF